MSDPLRVVPACMGGSAVAGCLSAAFHCTLGVPTGGIFIFPLVSQPLFYLLALAAGSFTGMALLAILRRPLRQTKPACRSTLQARKKQKSANLKILKKYFYVHVCASRFLEVHRMHFFRSFLYISPEFHDFLIFRLHGVHIYPIK